MGNLYKVVRGAVAGTFCVAADTFYLVARMIVGVVKESETIKPYMDRFMSESGMKLIDFSSSVGRNAARAVEAQICCDYLFDFMKDHTVVLSEILKSYRDPRVDR